MNLATSGKKTAKTLGQSGKVLADLVHKKLANKRGGEHRNIWQIRPYHPLDAPRLYIYDHTQFFGRFGVLRWCVDGATNASLNAEVSGKVSGAI